MWTLSLFNVCDLPVQVLKKNSIIGWKILHKLPDNVHDGSVCDPLTGVNAWDMKEKYFIVYLNFKTFKLDLFMKTEHNIGNIDMWTPQKSQMISISFIFTVVKENFQRLKS